MRKSKFKFMDKEEKNVEMVHLSPYMKSVIERLTADKKRPAVHTYNATLNSFTKFSGGQGTEEMLVTDVFTGRQAERVRSMAAKQKCQAGTRFPPICECSKRFTTGSWKQST